MDRNNSNPLIMGPLAWMVHQLQSIGIRFDESKLQQQFSRPRTWYNGPVFKPKQYERLIGLVTPTPGRFIDSSGAPPIEVHYSVRLRGFRISPGDITMPGYGAVQKVGNAWQWPLVEASRRSTNGSGTETITTSQTSEVPSPTDRARILNEAPIGELEARLCQLMLET
jgi:hypothetical protein